MDSRHHQPGPVSWSNSSLNPDSSCTSPFAPASVSVLSTSPASYQHYATHALTHGHTQTHAGGAEYLPDHRRTSDTPFYKRTSLTEPGHSRAQSASTLPVTRELSRSMPLPSTSPPQGSQIQAQQQKPHHHHHHHHHHHTQSQGSAGFGPPAPRPPPLSVGPPSSFPPARELPALGSIVRSGSVGNSSMSISSMLGGPPPASRASQPPQHYSSHGPPPPTTSAPGYASSIHASPRMLPASSEYPSFRRPQTPDHQRQYDPRAASPQVPYSTTPESQRYATPQGYHQRHPSAPAEMSRDAGRTSTGPPAGLNSQHKPPFGGPQSRPMDPSHSEDAYARREETRPSPGSDYKPERPGFGPYAHEERHRTARERHPLPDHREREDTDRAYTGAADARPQHLSPPDPTSDFGHRDGQLTQPSYGRLPDSRNAQEHWSRSNQDMNHQQPTDHQQRSHRPEYSPAPGRLQPQQRYQAVQAERYTTNSNPPQPSSTGPAHVSQPYEPDRARVDAVNLQRPPPLGLNRSREERGDSAAAGYNNPQFESPRKADDEHHAPHGLQRNLLAVQDINRKGRMSPLPQAVQGAQPQQPGPAAEPGIKSEFGRMFAGIGSGVSGIGMSSPTTSSAAAGAFPAHTSHPGASKGDDADSVAYPGLSASGKASKSGKRRKLKGDDPRDEDNIGKATTAGRANKRPKPLLHHHHQ